MSPLSPFPLIFLCLGIILLFFANLLSRQANIKSQMNAESFRQVNEIVAEAKASPDGKPLLDYIITLQKDGLTQSEAEDISVKYEDWKLFYSLKDAEAKQAVESVQHDKGS